VGGSRIHTCYTGIGGYFVKGFGGIRPNPEHPGMRHVLIKPAPVKGLTHANTEFESGYGKIVVNWKRSGNSATYHIEVPVNSWAKVYLPAVGKEHVMEGSNPAEQAAGVRHLGTERSDAVGNCVIYGVGSGVYEFSVSAVPEVTYPDPMDRGLNLSKVGRMSASSMHMASEKIPGFEAFKANDENAETSWRAASAEGQWLEVAWVKPQTFAAVRIDEIGGHITSYRLQAWKDDGWQDLATGDACGTGREHSFDPVTASKCRLLISAASKAPEIAEIMIRKSD
jgi:alpha-L-rhamnosidase